MIYNKNIFCIYFLFYFFSTPGCKKFVEIPSPTTQLVSENVFSSDATATAAINGLYSNCMNAPSFASLNVSLYGGLSADEFTNYSSASEQVQIFTNSLSSFNSNISAFWGQAYQSIYMANAILEGIQASGSLSAGTKIQLRGEASFLRAFFNFYLVNFFGEIPLAKSTNYQVNNSLVRSPVNSVYSQMIADLETAQQLLPADYSASGGNRTRPNKWAATAILARIYLYKKDWQKAADQSSALIGSSMMYSLVPDLNRVFLANSTEAIWQLVPVQPYVTTWEGYTFILNTAPNAQSLSGSLIKQFEPDDLRRSDWVDSITIDAFTYYFPYKYKIKDNDGSSPFLEYSMVLRLSEQYLIRAEAEAELNQYEPAVADLNVIRERAGVPDFVFTDEGSLLSAILHERQVELFTEWGHRWLDLKRTGMADSVLSIAKALNWTPNSKLYPIPQSEIKNNNRLTQNPGY